MQRLPEDVWFAYEEWSRWLQRGKPGAELLPPQVEVLWLDPAGNTGWHSEPDLQPQPGRSVAWLVRVDTLHGLTYIVLAGTIASPLTADDAFGSLDSIPLGCVVSITPTKEVTSCESCSV